MPTVPVVIADPMTRWLGRPSTATKVDVLSPGLTRITFEGDALRNRKWQPGSEIEFRVSTKDFRHYTPAAFDAEQGWIEVVFQRHGTGPGESFVERIQVGDDVLVLGPGGHAWLREGQHHAFAGDASAIGLFQSLLEGLPATAKTFGVVEVPAVDVEAAAALLPGLTVVAETGRPGEASLAWLTASLPRTPDCAYLAGHAQSIQRQRALLCADALDRPAMRRRDVVTKPFWADGKSGL
jgi:NADPH-dependent ferric siderophore reductase